MCALQGTRDLWLLSSLKLIRRTPGAEHWDIGFYVCTARFWFCFDWIVPLDALILPSWNKNTILYPQGLKYINCLQFYRASCTGLVLTSLLCAQCAKSLRPFEAQTSRHLFQNADANETYHGNHVAYISPIWRQGKNYLKRTRKSSWKESALCFWKIKKDLLAVDKIMQNLDPNWDGTVGLWNVLSLVAGLRIPWSDCSIVHLKPEEEEKTKSHTEALFLHWWAFFSRVTWKSCPNAFVNRLGPLGIMQITLNFKLTRRERNVSSMTETFLIFILFAPSFPQ